MFPPIPHQALFSSTKRLGRYYFVCACGYRRGRNARFPCSCGEPPMSWTRAEVRAYWNARKRHDRWLAKRGYCYCPGCGSHHYAASWCACGQKPINVKKWLEQRLRKWRRMEARRRR